MAVVPVSAVLCCLEFVGLDVAWSERTFRDAVDSILSIGTKLTKPVPVHRCTIAIKRVLDCQFKSISPVCLDCWSWALSVDDKHLLGSAIRWKCGVFYLQEVSHNPASVRPACVIVGVDIEASSPAATTILAVDAA